MTIAVSSRGISKLCRSYQCHITDLTCLRLQACESCHRSADHPEPGSRILFLLAPLETWRIAKVLNREQQASRRFHDEVVGGVEL
jgi:hypothetical protein